MGGSTAKALLDMPRVNEPDAPKKPRGRHPAQRLTPVKVKALSTPGRYADGNNLYLEVDERGAKRWLWRGVSRGKRCDLGLGSVVVVSLKEARLEALRLKISASKGEDVRAGRRSLRAAGTPTFKQAAITVHAAHSPSFRNAKHSDDWLNSLKMYAFPHFGARSIDAVTSADILKALETFWTAKPETARRVKQRIRAVLDWAKASGYRTGENPVQGITKALPRHKSSHTHYAAMPYAEIPNFIPQLREADAGEPARLALEWTILTCARSGEALGARWEEIDRDAAVWTVPAVRMKAGRVHRVPLSPRCLELLTLLDRHRDKSGYLFPGRKEGQSLSNMALAMVMRRLGRTETVHGFRSAFRDWASEQTSAPHAVCEAALAHTVRNPVEAAYARSDLFEKRRGLMGEWARYCGCS